MAVEQRGVLTRRRLHRLREEPEGVWSDGNGRRIHWRTENNGRAGDDGRVFFVAQEFRMRGAFLERGSYGSIFYDIQVGRQVLDVEAGKRGFKRKLEPAEVAAFVASQRDRRASQRAAAMIQRDRQL